MTDTRNFGAACAPLIAAGLDPKWLLPAAPLDATLASRSKVKAGNLPKVQGLYNPTSGAWSGRHSAYDGGQPALSWGRAPEKIEAEGEWPTDSIHVVGHEAVLFDVDVADPEGAEVAMQAIVETLGADRVRKAPRRVRPNAPHRTSLVFAASEPGAVPSSSMAFTRSPGAAERELIEWRGAQTYWVCGGSMHPSGVRFEFLDSRGRPWAPGDGPLDWKRTDLPAVTAEETWAVLERMQVLVEARGWTNDAARGGRSLAGSASSASAGGGGTRVRYDKHDPVVSPELFGRVLAEIECDRETMGGHDYAISVYASFYAALGSAFTEARPDIEAWGAGYDGDENWLATVLDNIAADGVEATAGGFAHWVKEQGSPELAAAVQAAVDAARGSPVQTFFGAIEEDDEDGDDEGRLLTAREQAVSRMIYYQTRKLWVDTATGMFMETSAFNDHQVGRAVTAEDLELRKRGSNGELKAVGAHKLLVDHAQVVDAITYAYGEPQVFTAAIDGPRLSYFNRCRPSRLRALGRVVTDDDVRPFLDHVEMLLPEDGSAGVLLDWMAYVVQHEKDKPTWAPVLVGPQGVGKDTALKPLKEAVGPHNFREVRPDDFVQRFTPFLESRVVVVQELDHSERRNAYERFKAPISGTAGGLLTIELKGQDPFRIIDRACFVILTNHSNALALSQDDRRFYVAQTTDTKPPREHFDRLHAWFDRGGHRKVLTWLRHRDLSGFMPHQPPAPTAAKLRMINQARSEPEQWICDQVESGQWAQRTILSAKGVLEAAREAVKPHRGVSNATPGSALTAAGWKRFPREMKVTLTDGRRPTLQLWLRDPGMLEPRQGESQKAVEKRILDTFRQEEDGGDDVIEAASTGAENGDGDAV